MGTAGGLGLIKEELNETFLMMNGDVLTTLDFSDLVNYHKRNGAIATIGLKKRDVKIDFGVVESIFHTSLQLHWCGYCISSRITLNFFVFTPSIIFLPM
ncbi:MAG TPA: nucleoside-diphosphate-sugar pyrophosphorylase, partial [Methanophagales archaeon]|nr:nucleoside-diphosphate-sugar pyrophosphorylase [Methanophagales archaeon]